MRRIDHNLCLIVLVMLGDCLSVAQVAAPREGPALSLIPFVGCKSDGQLGPQDAPSGKSVEFSIPAAVAQRLAYYKAASGVGVLAPRGWYCFGTYGSDGDALYVSPMPIKRDDIFSTKWKGFAGPVIEISYDYGGTSGRFAVAKVIAQVFPAHRNFVENVVADEQKVGLPGTTFPNGPYKKDVLKHRGKNVVEFLTSPNSEGLGTHSWLQKNGDPIRGVAILIGSEPDLIQLSVRLPSDIGDLTPFIIQQTERDATWRAAK